MAFPKLRTWSPFKIDALGLVTLLGADEMDRIVGQLTQSRYTDWLPLLGAFTIANNHITEPIPGFTLYNITEGILATDLAGWFGRWILCQDLTFCATSIFISTQTRQRPAGPHVCSCVFGMLTLLPIVFASIVGDWWGLANGISMLVSVIVRRIVLRQNQSALDQAADKAEKRSDQLVKVFLTMPDGKAVTILTTRLIVINCLLTTPRPSNEYIYNATQAIGWLAFGTHVISLGMATLFCQILSVCLLLLSTVLAGRQVGVDRYHIGERIFLHRQDAEEQFRAAAYARLQLTPEEENSMVHWHLFPQKTNKSWWDKFRQCQSEQNFRGWDKVLEKSAAVSA